MSATRGDHVTAGRIFFDRDTVFDRDTEAWGAVASLVVHAVVVAALLTLHTVHRTVGEVEPVERIEVELVAPPPAENPAPAAARPSVQAEPAAGSVPMGDARETPVPRSEPPAGAQVPASASPDGMIRATRLFSAEVLASPRSRRAREDLRRMAGDERLVQLCDLEALEQIHARETAFRPETLVAQASAEVRVSERRVEADGGAFASGGRWYAVSFRCEVSADLTKVVDFALRVGDEIPRRDWSRLALPAPGGSLD